MVVLDRDLPVMHGDEVCRTLRGEEPDSRVLMLTAAAGVDDLVDGLSLGADDYMPKPFAFAELVARAARARAPRRTRRARRRCAPATSSSTRRGAPSPARAARSS